MINKLVDKIVKTNAPVVVGLDPMMKFIPEHIQAAAFEQYGESLEGAAEAIWQFNKSIIDNIYDIVPAVKPQIAMYEQFGIEGLKVFKKTVDYCHEKDMVVIGDVKRGDIGSTSEAYAVAHLGKVKVGSKLLTPFDEDFATVNPYLGSDGINPFIKVCQEENSNVGAVVGATYPEMGKTLRKVMPKAYILVPGYGAQGGKAEDLAAFFNPDGLGAIVNSSRGIIAAYKKDEYAKFGDKNFGEASRQAALDMIADINGALGK